MPRTVAPYVAISSNRPKNRSRGPCRLTITIELSFILTLCLRIFVFDITEARIQSLKLHCFDLASNDQLRLCQPLNISNRHARVEFSQYQTFIRYLDDTQFCHDVIDDFDS